MVSRSPLSLPCCITVKRGSRRNLMESLTQYIFTGGSPSASHTSMAFLPFSTTFILGFCFIRGNPLGSFFSVIRNKDKIGSITTSIFDEQPTSQYSLLGLNFSRYFNLTFEWNGNRKISCQGVFRQKSFLKQVVQELK